MVWSDFIQVHIQFVAMYIKIELNNSFSRLSISQWTKQHLLVCF